jgi:Tfp pilus assembly protein PilO
MALPRLPDLQKLPFRLQVAVVAGILALVGVGGYAGLVMPRLREVRTLKAQLTRQEPDPGLAAPRFPPITEEERKLWAELEARLRKRFPEEKDLPGALEAVADLARSARMQLVTLNLQNPPAKPPPGGPSAPGGTPPSPAFSVQPPLSLSPTTIKLTAFHRYRDLVQFLDGLPRLPVAVAVESIETRRVDDRLSTEMTLRTLRWGAS